MNVDIVTQTFFFFFNRTFNERSCNHSIHFEIQQGYFISARYWYQTREGGGRVGGSRSEEPFFYVSKREISWAPISQWSCSFIPACSQVFRPLLRSQKKTLRLSFISNNPTSIFQYEESIIGQSLFPITSCPFFNLQALIHLFIYSRM